jgi:type IV secretion system protein VirB4
MKSPAELRKLAAGEVPLADYVPFGAQVSPSVIKLRHSNDYIAIWKLEGISFETSDFDELNAHKEGLNNFLRTLGGGSFALWSHKLRRAVSERLEGSFTNAFCAQLDERYHASFEGYRMMATELYLTLVYRASPSKVEGLFKRMATRTAAQIAEQQRAALDVMDDMAKQVEASLAKYGPQRLSTFDRGGVAYSGMASLLGFLVNGVWEDIPLRRASLAEYLPSARLHFGDRNGMLQIEHARARKFVGFLDFQEYPQFSATGMNNTLLYGHFEYIETQSFSMLNKREALKRLERQRNQLISGEEASVSEIEDMTIAEDQLQSGLIEMGEYHYSLAVLGDSLDAVAKNLADAKAAFDGPGFKMAVVDVVPECAWFAQLPGNWAQRPREASITSYNFACLSPLHNFATGKRSGNPWGEALALLKTPSGQPYFLNFHASPEARDNTDEKYPGNTSVLGFTGVGKTTVVGFLLAQSDKYQARLVAFDKDRGMEILIRAMGGRYTAFKRGEPTGINPFQWDDTPSNRQLCEQVVGQCVRMKGHALTPREQQDISSAVATVFALPLKLRRLGAVDQNLPNVGENSLRLRLKKWVGNNPLGWVVDNPRDLLALHSNRKFGFDYTEFLDDDEVRPVVMLMLLHATQTLIDGTPFIYVMEEFWKPLMDEVFSDFALNKQKTIRKENGLGVFVTQSPSDVLKHPIGKTMVEQSVTVLYLPNPRADYNDYVHGFKVTPHEFHLIKNLPEEGRIFLVKQGQRSALVKLDLGGLRDELVVLSGSIDNVQLLDDIRADVGDEPSSWMPILLRRVAERRALSKTATKTTPTFTPAAQLATP